jgi:hypothetical protein
MLSADRRAREARARALRWDPAFPPQADNDGTTRLTPEEADYRLTEDVNTSCKQCIFRLDNGDGTSACQRVVQTVDAEHVCDLVELPELADGKQAPGGPANGPVRHISRRYVSGNPDKEAVSGKPDTVSNASDVRISLLRYSEDQPRDADGEFAGGGGGEKSALTTSEKEAVYSYTGTSYHGINDRLRSGEIDPSSASNMGYPYTMIPDLDSAVEHSAPLAEATTVYRTIYLGEDQSTAAADSKAWLTEHSSGSFTDKGYVSTSGSSKGTGFPADPEAGSIQMEITLPAGTKAIDALAAIKDSHPDKVGSGTVWDKEHELILPRGSTFTIDSTRFSKITGGHMHLTLQAAA